MKKCITETRSIILKIYVVNFPICIIKFPVNLKYRISHRWCSLNSQKVHHIPMKTSVLESLFNKFMCLQVCHFTEKRLQHRLFPVNIANFKNTYFEKHLLVLIVVTYCIENWIKLFSKRIGLPNWPFVSFETWNHSILLTIIRIHLFYHSLSFSVTHCHFFVIRCHSLSLAVPLVVTRWITSCHSFYHSMSLVVTRCHSLY